MDNEVLIKNISSTKHTWEWDRNKFADLTSYLINHKNQPYNSTLPLSSNSQIETILNDNKIVKFNNKAKVLAELEEIRLHLQKEFSKEPKINLANEQESRNLEKIALEKVQLLKTLEKK